MAAIGENQPEQPTVLVVDDSRAIGDYARMMLEGAGYAVTTTTSYQQGVQLARTAQPPFNAIVQDHQLPDAPPEGGIIGMARELDQASLPSGLVGATASLSEIPAIELALQAIRLHGHVEVLSKPLTRNPLVAAVGRAAGLSTP